MSGLEREASGRRGPLSSTKFDAEGKLSNLNY